MESATPLQVPCGDRFSILPANVSRLVASLDALGHRVLWESASGELLVDPPAEPASFREAMEGAP